MTIQLDLKGAAAAVQGRLVGDNAAFIGVSTDTRSVRAGELFIALRGVKYDAHEFLATARVSLPVSQLAKWKTTFQMVSLGALILAPASAHWWPALPSQPVGLVTLWLAGLLTMITGWDYLRVGLKHMTDEA